MTITTTRWLLAWLHRLSLGRKFAILGLTKIQPRPVPGEGGAIDWRQMLPLSLSYDHRVINGADAARFTRCIADALAAYRFG